MSFEPHLQILRLCLQVDELLLQLIGRWRRLHGLLPDLDVFFEFLAEVRGLAKFGLLVNDSSFVVLDRVFELLVLALLGREPTESFEWR